VKFKSGKSFLGREALLAQKGGKLRRQMCGFTVAPEVTLLGRETIYRDGVRVGWLSSGGYGHTIGKGIGYGYVRWAEGLDRDWLLAGRDDLEVASERVPCAIFLAPPHDPGMERIKA
jgi:4-methylaminobutanoate oxidase (formaldehyde-forming)